MGRRPFDSQPWQNRSSLLYHAACAISTSVEVLVTAICRVTSLGSRLRRRMPLPVPGSATGSSARAPRGLRHRAWCIGWHTWSHLASRRHCSRKFAASRAWTGTPCSSRTSRSARRRPHRDRSGAAAGSGGPLVLVLDAVSTYDGQQVMIPCRARARSRRHRPSGWMTLGGAAVKLAHPGSRWSTGAAA